MVVLPLPVGPVTRMMPLGRGQRLAVEAERLALEAERHEVEHDAAAVEHAQHDRLAVHRRHGRDPQVDVAAAHRDLDPAVLGQPALGDVEAGHDLDARDDRGAELGRRRLDLAQHAVDAVADAQALLERLDVDVRGAGVDGARDHAADDPDDRRLARQIAQPPDVVLGAETAGVDGLDQLAGRGAAAVQALERGLDVARRRDPGPDRLAGEQLHRADRVVVERIGHRDREAVLGLGERQDVRLLEEVDADPLALHRQVGEVRGPGERQLEQLRQRLGDIALGHQAELDQEAVQGLGAGLGQTQRPREPGRVELALPDQQLAEHRLEARRLVAGACRQCCGRHPDPPRPQPVRGRNLSSPGVPPTSLRARSGR